MRGQIPTLPTMPGSVYRANEHDPKLRLSRSKVKAREKNHCASDWRGVVRGHGQHAAVGPI